MVKVPGTAAGVERVPPADRRRRQHQRHAAVRRRRGTARSPTPTSRASSSASPPAAPLDHIDSVASFFVSRIDNEGRRGAARGLAAAGKIAIANAKVAYADVYQVVFAGPRWEQLKAAGANPQRPLWASTSTKNPAYPATLYADELIGPDTVNTVPDATLDAFREGGHPARTLDRNVDEARAQLAGPGRRRHQPGRGHRRARARGRQGLPGGLQRHDRSHRREARPRRRGLTRRRPEAPASGRRSRRQSPAGAGATSRCRPAATSVLRRKKSRVRRGTGRPSARRRAPSCRRR